MRLTLQILLTCLLAMQHLFGTALIDWAAWIRIVLFGMALMLMLIVEMEKFLLGRTRSAAAAVGTKNGNVNEMNIDEKVFSFVKDLIAIN